MGFQTAPTAHDALLGRQDAELRLLELMRRCVHNKLKSDRDYALALTGVAVQGLKMERTEELSGSLVAQAWRGMMASLEGAGRLLRQNADALEARALERLNALHAEKRRARKLFQEEHARLAAQLSQLTEDVSRKKSEYQKYLEIYKMMRSKFEENYVKAPAGRGGRKLDETRDKFQKACRRLHVTHNEYVLLLNEAAEFEREYRSVLIPGLIERQQAVQEACIKSWKEILLEIVKLSDMTTGPFREAQVQTETSVDAILPQDEYRDLTEKHKNNYAPAVSFTFDDSLVEDTSGKLLPNKLAVDNLTIESLRTKLQDLETSLKEEQEKITVNQTDGVTGRDSPSRVSIGEVSRKDSADHRVSEQRLQKQIELIKSALSELGCEEVPSGCDLSLEASIPDAQDTQSQFQSQITLNSQRPLTDEEWFHGVLPREEVVRLLTHEGDFLVRETTRNDENQTVLSVRWGGHKHFIVQTTAEGHFRFEGPAFPTIQELILHQYQSGLPVTGRSGAILRRPILRERWELNNDDVLLLDKIGRGNFGDVYKARLKSTKQEVAVKTCRMTLPEEHKKKFLQEGRILKQYDHPNIVKLIGICVQKQPIMIVMELVPGGSLLTFLRNRGASLTQKQLLGMCRDAAAGMQYLESKNCIHRDLAARNCLVGYDNIVKISDFGMSREEEEYIVSDGMKQIPIKWTAPEALNFGKYTSLCDVWSYGVLCWEIFALGGTPYNGLSNSKAREKIDSGYRMPPPEGTPDEMYRLMLRCWEYDPENRPHFNQIYLVVDTLYNALLR